MIKRLIVPEKHYLCDLKISYHLTIMELITMFCVEFECNVAPLTRFYSGMRNRHKVAILNLTILKDKEWCNLNIQRHWRLILIHRTKIIVHLMQFISFIEPKQMKKLIFILSLYEFHIIIIPEQIIQIEKSVRIMEVFSARCWGRQLSDTAHPKIRSRKRILTQFSQNHIRTEGVPADS